VIKFFRRYTRSPRRAREVVAPPLSPPSGWPTTPSKGEGQSTIPFRVVGPPQTFHRVAYDPSKGEGVIGHPIEDGRATLTIPHGLAVAPFIHLNNMQINIRFNSQVYKIKHVVYIASTKSFAQGFDKLSSRFKTNI
jgi:hypothetical protein